MAAARVCSRPCFGWRRRRRGTSRCSSFWPIRRGIRSCWCGLCGAGRARDRRGGVGGRRHGYRQGRQALAGGEAAVLGHAGQDRQLPDRRLACTRSVRAGRLPLGLAAVPARGVVRGSRAAAEGEDPGRGRVSRPSRSSRSRVVPSGRPAGRCRRRRCSRDAAYGDRHRASARACTQLGLEYVLAVRRGIERVRARDDLRGAASVRARRVGRRRLPARPQARVGALARRAAAGDGLDDAALPRRARPVRRSSGRFAFVRVVATHPVRTTTSRRGGSG